VGKVAPNGLFTISIVGKAPLSQLAMFPVASAVDRRGEKAFPTGNSKITRGGLQVKLMIEEAVAGN